MSEIFVGFGSNLGDRSRTLRHAVTTLDAMPGVRLRDCSGMRETEPVGGPPQPHFVNAVARFDAAIPPDALLRVLQEIEHAHGRRRGVANGPRTLDLDLLLYGHHRLAEEGLAVPHPRMEERAFVLGPLAEIAPRLALGDGTLVRERLAALEAR